MTLEQTVLSHVQPGHWAIVECPGGWIAYAARFRNGRASIIYRRQSEPARVHEIAADMLRRCVERGG